MTIVIDDRDTQIIAERVAALDAKFGPRVGDYVDFADGTSRRISHVWRDENDAILDNGIQTSTGGSWYLGHGYCSFSGSLFTGIDVSTLKLTDETRDGSAWIFHHDHHRAHNGVDVTVPFRVFACSLPANRY